MTPARAHRLAAAAPWAVAAATALAFWPSVGGGFVNFDDTDYVADNPRVLAGLSAGGAAWALTAFAASNWHPLTWLSLQLDAELFGPGPAGFHRTNVLLHAASAALTYVVFRRLTGAAGRSFALALLFALHPLRVESVAWVAERKDVLSTALWLLTTLAYTRYAEAPSRGRMAAVAALFLLGLAAKPMLVTLPFTLLLLDFWPLRRLTTPRDLWPLAREKCPLFALVVAACVLTVAAQARAGAVKGADVLPVAERLANAPVAAAVYLGMTAWPENLCVFYPLPASRPAWQPAGAALLLLGITAAAWGLRRRAPYFLVGWHWYLGTLVPVIGLVQVGSQAYADRYTYIPHLGLLLALVWGTADLLRSAGAPPWAGAVFVALLAAGGAAQTVRQQRHWVSSPALWERALAVAPAGNGVAWYNLADHALREGRDGDAVDLYRKAADDPAPASRNRETALANVMARALRLGRLADAERAARELLDVPGIEPRAASDARLILGQVHYRRGEYAPAEALFRETAAGGESGHEAPLSLALLLARTGRASEAVDWFRAAHKLAPDDADVHYLLGLALGELGDWPAAAGTLEGAARLRPESGLYRGALAEALLAAGKREAAAAEAREAGRRDPAWPEQARADAWRAATAADPAARDGRRAARRAWLALAAAGPDAARLDALAAASAELGQFDEAAKLAGQAATLAERAGDPSAAAIRARLALYRDRRPYREAP